MGQASKKEDGEGVDHGWVNLHQPASTCIKRSPQRIGRSGL